MRKIADLGDAAPGMRALQANADAALRRPRCESDRAWSLARQIKGTLHDESEPLFSVDVRESTMKRHGSAAASDRNRLESCLGAHARESPPRNAVQLSGRVHEGSPDCWRQTTREAIHRAGSMTHLNDDATSRHEKASGFRDRDSRTAYGAQDIEQQHDIK